jgi:hypothetical protein
MTVAENLAAVRARIVAACEACGRDPSSVALVAVSKFHEAAAIREAYTAGQRLFGESYVQELAAKRKELADLPDLQFHFIGHLQSNKVKALLATEIACVETVHSPALARELGKRVKLASARPPGTAEGGEETARKHEKGLPVLPVLAEINVGREANKHGALPEEAEALVAAIEAEPALRFQGWMTIPPDDEIATKAAFEALAALHAAGTQKRGRPLTLSMGMSGDLELAIACGATLVRVGTAIFGARS